MALMFILLLRIHISNYYLLSSANQRWYKCNNLWKPRNQAKRSNTYTNKWNNLFKKRCQLYVSNIRCNKQCHANWWGNQPNCQIKAAQYTIMNRIDAKFHSYRKHDRHHHEECRTLIHNHPQNQKNNICKK